MVQQGPARIWDDCAPGLVMKGTTMAPWHHDSCKKGKFAQKSRSHGGFTSKHGSFSAAKMGIKMIKTMNQPIIFCNRWGKFSTHKGLRKNEVVY
jgi:hypothetical protein